MQCVTVEVMGERYYPLYNLEAMCRIDEELGADAFSRIFENTRDGIKLSLDVFMVLCEEGEAARKAYGYDAGAPTSLLEKMSNGVEMTPADLGDIRKAINEAVSLGCSRQAKQEGPIDLILLEHQKKTASAPNDTSS